MDNIPPEYLNQIVTGDARELAKRIPDESIDLIFTDPIYDRIDDYRWLAETAARVLKQGGNLIAQSGWKIYDCETLMNKYDLKMNLPIVEVFPFASQQVHYCKAFMGYKPYIWFQKGNTRIGQWIHTRMYGGGSSKDNHKWEDSPKMFIEIINRLSEPSAIVLDSFSGSGTVPAVCKMLGRNYIAFEIVPDTAERARERVRNTQPPLFVLQPEQQEMMLNV